MLSMEAAVEISSLEQKIGGDDGKDVFLLDRLAADESEQDMVTDQLFIRQLLEHLNDREKMLIHLRYFENQTQVQVAQQLKISQVQVGRLEKKILRKLKDFA